MKSLWIKLDGNWNDIKPLVTSSIETGVEVLVLEKENVPRVKELARGIKVATEGRDGDIKIVKVDEKEDLKELREGSCALIEIDRREKEELAVAAAKNADWVLIETKDWKIIPLENLVAKLDAKKLLTFAENIEEIKLVLGILEKGVSGIVFSPKEAKEIKKAQEILVSFSKGKIGLIPAKIARIKPIGLGDRVCIDTVSLLKVGEGMLVGSRSNGFFLVHSETIENPYVETRPFRVNAGAVYAYIKVPEGKTKYLAELKAGDEVLIVNKEGEAKREYIGRIKIERRPLILIETEIKGEKINTILQNAETISLIGKDGQPISISKLKVGDEVLVNLEQGGRHFGIKVEETLMEK